MTLLAVFLDSSSPFSHMRKPANAFYSTRIVCLRSPIALIFRVRCFTQIHPAIIGAVGIAMINLVFRKSSSDVEPRETMSLVFSLANRDMPIPIPIETSGNFSWKTRVPCPKRILRSKMLARSFTPCENARLGIIFHTLLEIVSRQFHLLIKTPKSPEAEAPGSWIAHPVDAGVTRRGVRRPGGSPPRSFSHQGPIMRRTASSIASLMK
jgi:hypothetical protein